MSRLSRVVRLLFKRNNLPTVWGTLRAEKPFTAGHAYFTGECTLGAYSYCNANVWVYHADIGRYCSVATGAVIGALAHRLDRLVTHPNAGGKPDTVQRVSIGNDVWIGTNAIIMPGVAIGDGAVIGAGAVVTKDVPPYAIAVG